MNENLVIRFRKHLIKSKGVSPATVKNYLADLRHFLSWLDNSPSSITSKKIREYKNFLLTKKHAKSTINRKLSTLRVFCQFGQQNGVIRKNLSEDLPNLSVKRSSEKEIHDLISKFGAYLKKKRASRNTIKNYTADIRQYLEFCLNGTS